MKKFLIVLLALLLLACSPGEPLEDEGVEAEEVEEVEEEHEEEVEIEEPVLEEEEEAEEAQKPLDAELVPGFIVYLDAFVELSPESTSYVNLPVFSGPEALANYWSMELEEDFYRHLLLDWEHINLVQDEEDRADPFADFTLYRIDTSIFKNDSSLVILARQMSVFGYSFAQKNSKVYFIDRLSGDAIGSREQLASHGVTLEDALAQLKKFQDDNSAVPFDEMSPEVRRRLYEEELVAKEELASSYGSQGQVILNDFVSPESYEADQIFIGEIDGRDYYIFKLLLASLEESMLDNSFRDDIYVGVPVDYQGGELELEEDTSGLLDGIYG